LEVSLDVARWLDPNSRGASLYQTADRLATAAWLRDQGIGAWLCHPLFFDDTLHEPTSEAEWRKAIHAAHEELDLHGADIPFAGYAFLAALDPEQELANQRYRPGTPE
jgi:hypothetical protein